MRQFASLTALVAVVEAGSPSLAAERLAVGKSIVSRQVNALEASLGVQPLQRTARPPTPGRAGPLSFGQHHLNAPLAGSLERHPGIEIDLALNDRELNLVEEGPDMTVRIGDLRDFTLLTWRLGTARFVT